MKEDSAGSGPAGQFREVAVQQPVIVAGGRPRRSPRWIVTAVGVLVMAAGIGLLVWPFIAAGWILAILFGSALIANGLALMVRSRSRGFGVAGGALLLIAGLVAIAFPQFTANALVTFVGVGFIATGAIWILIGSRLGGAGAPVALAPGVLLVVGGAIALIWPSIALGIVAVLGGLCMLLIGAALIAGSRSLGRAGRGGRREDGSSDASNATIII